MDFKIFLIFCICVSLTTLQVLASKRIKRNSLNKNSRIKEDFVVLHTGKQDLRENNDHKEAIYNPVTKEDHYNISKNPTTDSDKKRNVVKPLAVILREREQKLNEHQREASKQQEALNELDMKEFKPVKGNNIDKMEKHAETNVHFEDVQNRDHKRKHLPHMMHAANVNGGHQTYEMQLNPFAPVEPLMKYGNMMMFKVGMDSLPSNSLIPFSSRLQMTPNSLHNLQRNFYQQINEPSFEYAINSIEGPQEEYFNLNTPLQTNSLIVQQPVTNNESSELVNLMQTALDTLLTNSNNNEREIELKCPIHYEKKSINNKDKGDDTDIIQVCSCRFIKNTKEDNKQQK